ncbi:MAG: hypothetical protein R6U68_14655 [Desulfobacteraceae bacterium]
MRREARLNAELLGKMKGIESLIEELSINTLQEVFEMPIPLNKIMNKHLSDRVKDILNNNKKYHNWTKNVHSEADLVERLWHRTRMLQINKKYKQVKPNLAYLCVLNRALVELSWEKTQILGFYLKVRHY